MRQIKVFDTADGPRFRVRYRSGGKETSETFRRKMDAETFAGILGDGKDGRVAEALAWLEHKRTDSQAATFGEWFETWRAQLTGITPRTRDDYASLRRRYLSELDPLPLPMIGRAHIAAIVNRMDRDGLSRKTIQNAIHMLSAVFAVAVDEGHVARNPVTRVRLPKQNTDEHDARFLTYEEAGALVAALPAHYRPFVTFLLGTGLRWSEATALQARHVNLTAGTVRVERAWKRVQGGVEIGPPKSRKSRRTVNAAVPALVAVKPLLRSPNDLVFTAVRGGPVRHGHFYNRVWVPACESAGLDPQPRIHDTRHCHASWLLSDGQPLEAVQDQLGHESYETTRKLYAHLLPAVGVAVGRSASAAMERVLAQRPDTLALEAGAHPDQ